MLGLKAFAPSVTGLPRTACSRLNAPAGAGDVPPAHSTSRTSVIHSFFFENGCLLFARIIMIIVTEIISLYTINVKFYTSNPSKFFCSAEIRISWRNAEQRETKQQPECLRNLEARNKTVGKRYACAAELQENFLKTHGEVFILFL